MTKKEVLRKLAKHEVAKFTGLGLAVGAIPGASEFLRAQTIKDPEIRKRVRQNAYKRFGVGLPIGGSIGYGTGKVLDTLHSSKTFFDTATKATENAAKFDVENANKVVENASKKLEEMDKSKGRIGAALKGLIFGGKK